MELTHGKLRRVSQCRETPQARTPGSRPTSQTVGVNPVALDQPIKVIAPTTNAFFALDVEHVELAEQVSENNNTFTR
jgi:hypothetical protein